ncbi:MAG: hypothetical protein Kow0042_10280 [Calditrichia bacterium]
MRAIYYGLVCLIFCSGIFPLYPQNPVNKPFNICGSPPVGQVDVQEYLEKLKRENPEEYNQILATAEVFQKTNWQNLTTRSFWAYNFKTEKYYQISATLRRSGNLSNIWVEDESWSKGYVNDDILNVLLAGLEDATDSSSIDPNKGIVEIDTMLFGQPPNVDGDGIIDFLVLNIQDNFDSTANPSFIAGYFSPTDQLNTTFSNKMDLMYIDAYPGIFYRNSYRTDRALSTIAHELQHLIHYRYDKSEEPWINEGLSQLAGTYCGYGLDFPRLYLENTNDSLMHWSNQIKDYARINLWMLYCAEQLGLDFIRYLVQSNLKGVSGFNQAVLNSGQSKTLPEIFSDWVVANWINNPAINSRYGYQWRAAKGLHAKVHNLLYTYPSLQQSGLIKHYGIEYHRFRGGDSLQINFVNFPPESRLLIQKENTVSFMEPAGTSILLPEFSDDSIQVLLLYSTGGDAFYKYNADANYSLRYFELTYDDGESESLISFSTLPAIAANKFTVPEANLNLESIQFFAGGANYDAKIHLYNSSASGLPEYDIIPPIEKYIYSPESWVEVLLPQPYDGFEKGDVFFAGVEIGLPNKSLGYDGTQPFDGKSYLQMGGGNWGNLRSFANGSFPGDWMIRATLTALLPSDSIPPTQPGTDFIVKGNYPNPLYSEEQLTKIHFEIPEAGEVRLVVYNILGQKVADIKRNFTASENEFVWNGRGKSGILPSGIYFYQLIYTNPFSAQRKASDFKKIVILK